jgi:hypothetical protein
MEHGQIRTGDELNLQQDKGTSTFQTGQQRLGERRLEDDTPVFQWRDKEGVREVDRSRLGQNVSSGSNINQGMGQQGIGQQGIGQGIGQQGVGNIGQLDTSKLGPPVAQLPQGTVFALGQPNINQQSGLNTLPLQGGLQQGGLQQGGLQQGGIGQPALMGEQVVKDKEEMTQHLRRLSFGQEPPFVIENPPADIQQKVLTGDHILLREGQPQLMPLGGVPVAAPIAAPIPMQQSFIPQQGFMPQQQGFVPQQFGYGQQQMNRPNGYYLDNQGIMEADYRATDRKKKQWWKFWDRSNRKSRKNKNVSHGGGNPVGYNQWGQPVVYQQQPFTGRPFIPAEQYRQQLNYVQPIGQPQLQTY